MLYIYFVENNKSWNFAFLRFAKCLEFVLNKNNQVKIINKYNKNINIEEDIIIFFNKYPNNNIEIFNKVKKKILILSEPLYVEKNKHIIDYINNNDLLMILNYNKNNSKFIKNKKVVYTPLLYCEYLEKIYNRSIKYWKYHKDIDILFFGGVNSRRRKIKYKLLRHNLKVIFKDFNDYVELIRNINRTKIVLVIQAYDNNHILDHFRINLLLSNKIFFIHEKIVNDYDIFEDNIIFSKYDNIVNTCLKYLKLTQQEREALAIKTYNWIKQNHSFEKYLNETIKYN